ncbi:WXG100 family type VII secretion target, partial [Bacillus cereus group sp. MYBK139-2]
MVQIKVTPEMLEEIANRASNTRIALESIHNNLCNEIDRLCFQWIGASNQQFVQMFNDARPKAFTAINSIIQVEEDLKRIAEKFRNADDQDVTMEEGAMCGKPSSEEKGFDSGKLARDITGELTGEYDIRRVWDGIDPSTGEKLSGWERAGAGFMAVAGLTPFGKLAKVGKGVKMTANAVESVKTAEKAAEGIKTAERVAEAKNIPGRGYHKEVYANKPVKVQDAVTKW